MLKRHTPSASATTTTAARITLPGDNRVRVTINQGRAHGPRFARSSASCAPFLNSVQPFVDQRRPQLRLLAAEKVAGSIEHSTRGSWIVLDDGPGVAIADHVVLAAHHEERRSRKWRREIVDVEGKPTLEPREELLVSLGTLQLTGVGEHRASLDNGDFCKPGHVL